MNYEDWYNRFQAAIESQSILGNENQIMLFTRKELIELRNMMAVLAFQEKRDNNG